MQPGAGVCIIMTKFHEDNENLVFKNDFVGSQTGMVCLLPSACVFSSFALPASYTKAQ